MTITSHQALKQNILSALDPKHFDILIIYCVLINSELIHLIFKKLKIPLQLMCLVRLFCLMCTSVCYGACLLWACVQGEKKESFI